MGPSAGPAADSGVHVKLELELAWLVAYQSYLDKHHVLPLGFSNVINHIHRFPNIESSLCVWHSLDLAMMCCLFSIQLDLVCKCVVEK